MITLSEKERALLLEALRSCNNMDTLAQIFDEADRSKASDAIAKQCILLEDEQAAA